MNDLIQQINQLLQDRTLLRHPFYILWSEGKLTLEALAGYSKEYYQLVKAVPECVGTIAKQAPESEQTAWRSNQAEEHSHIALWESFAQYICTATGTNFGDAYAGTPKTQQAVANFRALCSDYVEGAAAMYAFEKALPEISTTKVEGLRNFYNIQDESATTYFEVHAVVDIVHAQAWAEVLNKQLNTNQLFSVATRSLDAQHLLLDACYETYC